MKLHQDSSTAPSKPNAAIGFTAILNGQPDAIKKSQQTIRRALSHFEEIEQLTLISGQTSLTIWGRGQLQDCYHHLRDGSLLILIGSPVGNYSWRDIEEKVLNSSLPVKFTLPWEGRVILLKIDPNSNTWTLWNDWVGSIPVFHAKTASGRIASTLEPVVVNVLGYTAGDIFLPSVMALLIWGHYFSDWSLFKSMKVIPPDGEAIWDHAGFRFTQYLSVKPTQDRWEYGWDDLVDEMHALSKKAIASTLDQHTQWILPLSSGLDSRLIAGVATELNKNVYTYTWGSARTSDVIHAKNIARALDLPWKYINPGNTYLTAYKQLWIDLFGSAMHFHGMYQMPFLDALKTEPSGPIVSGFIGECLAGYDVKFICEIHSSSSPFQLTPDDYLHWKVKELPQLMIIPIESALNELAAEVENVLASIPGPLHLRLKYLILWGRQRHFTYFQSMLSDYWRGVSTPYLDRDYARFSFSLPRAVFDERILQKAMLHKHYPILAAIPGTYAPQPTLLTGSYLLKKHFAKYLPRSASKVIFPDLYRTRSKSDVECVKKDGRETFSLLFDQFNLLEKWMSREVIETTYQSIIENDDMDAVSKLQSIETFAYRLSEHKEHEPTL